MSQKRKDKRRSATIKVFNHYGNVCGTCGISDHDVLTIDHINQDGAEHRKRDGIGLSGRNFHQWLVANGFPEGFRTLCFNCNMKAWRNHQRSLLGGEE